MRAVGIDAIVVALCADFARRQSVIAARTAEHRVDMEYRYLNFKMLDAAQQLLCERDALIMIEEIGGEIGYARSRLVYIGEQTYKEYKRKVKDLIAVALHLK